MDSILLNIFTHFASQMPLLSLTQLKSKTGGKSCPSPSLPIGLPLQTFLSPVSKQKSPKNQKRVFSIRRNKKQHNIFNSLIETKRPRMRPLVLHPHRCYPRCVQTLKLNIPWPSFLVLSFKLVFTTSGNLIYRHAESLEQLAEQMLKTGNIQIH